MKFITLKRADLPLQPTKHVVGGTEIFLQLSSNDVPVALSSNENVDTGMLEFRFLYSDQEPSERKVRDGVALLVGKHSGKLLGIDLDSKQHPHGIINLIIQSLEHEKSDWPKSDASNFNRWANYGLIQNVVKSKAQELALGY